MVEYQKVQAEAVASAHVVCLLAFSSKLVRKPGFAPEPSVSQAEMLLLHHNPDGAPGRTRTDEYEFTKLALLLLRHRGKMASTAGVAPATSTFARWRSDLTELRGQSHPWPGLAPARVCLKGRLLEPLCIHGLTGRGANKWSPRLVSRQRLLIFREALICLSYSGIWSSWQVTLLRLPVISRALCF
jgi:hypothetical protein